MTPEKLRQIPLFATLNPEETLYLLKHAVLKKYPPHTIIFWMDEPGDNLYVIEKGKVAISYTTKEGKERTFSVLGEGDFFGELSLLDGGPHTGTARTITETAVVTISQATFYNFLEKHPQFSRTLLAVLVDRLRSNTNLMRQFGNVPVNVPIKVLQESASLRKFVDRAAKYIASSRFLIVAIIFVFSWIGFNTWYYRQHHNSGINMADNPPTFFFLGFILTICSFLFTILVLTSQRGLAEQDRINAEIEYQVNLKAQSEIMRLQLKMDEILRILEQQSPTDV